MSRFLRTGWFCLALLLPVIGLSILAGDVKAGAEYARMETVTVVTARGSFEFAAEIADTPQLRRRGLMFRQRLPKDKAMLFDWGGRQLVANMWMRNTYIPLDMVFIASDGTVVRVAGNTKPRSLKIISSGVPVAAVLEIAAGTARRIGLEPGSKVRHMIFSRQSRDLQPKKIR